MPCRVPHVGWSSDASRSWSVLGTSLSSPRFLDLPFTAHLLCIILCSPRSVVGLLADRFSRDGFMMLLRETSVWSFKPVILEAGFITSRHPLHQRSHQKSVLALIWSQTLGVNLLVVLSAGAQTVCDLAERAALLCITSDGSRRRPRQRRVVFLLEKT
jgi:hypothetical protein